MVIDHLFSQAALKIKDDGQAKKPAQHQCQQCPFMQMGMNDIIAPPHQQFQALYAQQQVKDQLMAAGTDLVVAAPGNGQGSLDLNIGHPLAIVIGGNRHLMAQLLQRTRLF